MQQGSRGQAMVEFALVAGLFFFLFFAVLDLGIYSFDRLGATEIAREVARLVAVGSADAAELEKINNRLQGMKQVKLQLNYYEADAELLSRLQAVAVRLPALSGGNLQHGADAAVTSGNIRICLTAVPRFTIGFAKLLLPAELSSGNVEMRLEN